MAAGGDFYAVLGLTRDCSDAELRTAYKKLALRWHPDRCSEKSEDEAKIKFQAIQEAYSVLSDSNKRLMYDIGVYDNNSDDDEEGMEDFLGEMAEMMSQTNNNEGRHESFEELQRLFVEMFQADLDAGFGGWNCPPPSTSTTVPLSYCSNKRGSSAVNSDGELDSGTGAFCFGVVSLAGGLRISHGINLKWATKRRLRMAVSCSSIVAKPETLQVVGSTIAKQLSIDESTVTPQTKFSDLGADSLDTVEIMMALEEKFGVSIGEEGAENITTVQDAANLIEKVKAEGS